MALNPRTDSTKPPTNSSDLRALWGRKVNSVHDFMKKEFDREIKHYLKMYRHEFTGILPERLLASNRVDVNVIFPVVKTLIPSLYFQDPKVFVKTLQEKITKQVQENVLDESGQEFLQDVVNPETGEPIIEEFDAVRSGLIFQNALNQNMERAKVKQQIKAAILDAHLTYYGAVKCGWGNEQGVASMGQGAPPSVREDISDDLAYAIRLKPWDVVVDMQNFYHPKWIAIRYTVHPEQLRQDKRLKHTEQIHGMSQIDQLEKDKFWRHLTKEDLKQTEYFEIYVKPCAEYPNGKYFIMTDEVKEDFLFEGEWPLETKHFPVKLLYFNPDPESGLPIPDVKYYANHQKAKLNLRNAEYDYVQRTMPIMGIDLSGVKDQDRLKKQLTAGTIPRVVECSRNPQRVLSGVSYPSLNIDFRNLDANIDTDISRMVGLVNQVTPTSNSDNQLASALKLADKGEQIRQNERADVVSDWLTEIIELWAQLYQEFAGPENYTTIEGEKFPARWSRDEINGKFLFKIKPFSMSYEDPVIRRKQWVDLLNLLAAPEARAALAEQGASVNILKIIQRILETYDERDVESFVIDDTSKPENQVALALKENEEIQIAAQEGRLPQVQVNLTDNDKLHIMIHGLVGDFALEHIEAHQQAMLQKAGISSPGGGNQEGLPVNGVAVNQDNLKQSPAPSPTNSKIAISREAAKT